MLSIFPSFFSPYLLLIVTMFFFLSKFLPLFIYPLGLASLLILAAIFLYRRQSWQRASLIMAFLLLWLGGNRFVAYSLARPLEWQHLPASAIPPADVIVVLGGGTRTQDHPRPLTEVGEGGDRVIYATYLYRAGIAPHILVTGGRLPNSEENIADAENMRTLLELFNIPSEAIWLESTALNTYENALYSQSILQERGINRIILITSAIHMPRSVKIFEKRGFEVIPAPTDFEVTESAWNLMTHGTWQNWLILLVPNANNLELTTRALKEYIGIFVYGLRGWL